MFLRGVLLLTSQRRMRVRRIKYSRQNTGKTTIFQESLVELNVNRE